jgi:hypothetical protein
MPNPTRKSELVLVLSFLAVIAGVPVTQTCIELARHERVQATDVFRYRPTAKNLRQFEHTLAEKSWFQQHLRPLAQRFLFATLRDTGAKGVLGRDRWLFYRPDLRYLVEPDRAEAGRSDSRWVEPPSECTHRGSVEKAILRFRDQLKERGITLVVMPVPGKPSVYPDQVTRRAAGKERQFQSPTLDLIEGLQRQGVATVDLFAAFQTARQRGPPGRARSPSAPFDRDIAGTARSESAPYREVQDEGNGALYLAQDTHWTPLGAQIAAQTVAAKLSELNFAPPTAKEFRTQRVTVTRWGDILDMMQITGLRGAFTAEPAECLRVLDPALGPMVPAASARPGTYCYPGQQATVLVLGDSFCRIYQYAEPQSLGDLPVAPAGGRATESGTRRLLPGSAGFISHLALALKSPVDAIVSDGGAATDVRRKLSTDPEILEGKRIVVWEFVERDIALGAQGWEEVPLPRRLQ